jgi:endonuclease V-like protein UPF0215 family
MYTIQSSCRQKDLVAVHGAGSVTVGVIHVGDQTIRQVDGEIFTRDGTAEPCK